MTKLAVLTLAAAAIALGETAASYTITTVAGAPPGAVTRLDTPNDLQFDTAGNLYVAETVGGRVLRISPSLRGTVVASNVELAWGVAPAPDGSVYATTLKHVVQIHPTGAITTTVPEGILAGPFGLTVDRSGALYIADAFGHRILRHESDGNLIPIAGTGSAGLAGDGGPAAQAEINFPNFLRFDSTGNLYFTDTFNKRVRRIDLAGKISTVAQVDAPTRGIAIAPDDTVYFSADDGRVYRIGPEGVRAVAGSGEIYRPGRPFLPPLETDMRPMGLAVDTNGRLYISDTQTQVIWTFRDDGKLTMIAGGAQIMPGLAIKLDYPAGLASDSSGNVVIADRLQHRVITLAPDGVASVNALSADVWNPVGVATGSDGVLYVASRFNNMVFRSGTDYEHSALPFGAIAPTGVAVGAGTVFALDYGHGEVRALPPSGVASTISSGLTAPWGLSATPSGDLLVADSGANRVLRITLAGAQTVLPAPPDGYASPYAAAADDAGNIYVTDRYHHRILRITSEGTVDTIAGNGTPGYSGDGGPAAAAQLDGPWGITATTDGSIYFSDANNGRVRKLTPVR